MDFSFLPLDIEKIILGYLNKLEDEWFLKIEKESRNNLFVNVMPL